MGLLKSVVDFIPNIINAGAQIHATNANARTAKLNTQRTNEANQKMAEYQYSKDLQMWNMQNEYNSPKQQMQRYSQAGLSPNLIYGQGNSGNATTLPKYSAPRQDYNYQPRDYTKVIGQYQDFTMRQAQIDNVKSQIENTKAKTVNEGLLTALRGILERKGNIDLQTYGDMNSQRLQNLFNSGQLQLGQARLQKYSGDYKKMQIQAFDKLLNQQMQLTESNILKNRSTTDLLGKQIGTYNLGLAGKLAPGAVNLLRAIFGKK
ncbi:MAG: DNA pilot protein [Microviridae sp.]|nr:MAG: DNA pilot protein [Microviridae sp.]